MKKRLHILTFTICFCIMHIVLNVRDLSIANASEVNAADSKAGTHASAKVPSSAATSEFEVKTLASSGEDKDSFVLAIMGDGFTKDEQEEFNKQAQIMSDYILDTKPFSDAKDKTNIYAIDVISNESGAAMDPSSPLDTYFGCSFNTSGIDRLLCSTKGNPEQVAKEHIPDYDFAIILVNSTKYGGSGGSLSVASLNESCRDVLLHEMGHSIGKLVDEYWFVGEEGPNMTQESDPTKVKWKEYLNEDGIGVFPYKEPEAAGWYRPSENCKMSTLNGEFCAVCSAAIAKQIDAYSKTVVSDESNSSNIQNVGIDNGNAGLSNYNSNDYSNFNYGNKDYSNSNYGRKDYSNSNYGNKDYSNSNYNSDDYSNTGYGSNKVSNSSNNNYSQNYKNKNSYRGKNKYRKNTFERIAQWFGGIL